MALLPQHVPELLQALEGEKSIPSPHDFDGEAELLRRHGALTAEVAPRQIF